MKIETDFDIGEIVYLITDEDQSARMITRITISPNNGILYELCQGMNSSSHYAMEISRDIDIKKQLNISGHEDYQE